MTKDVNVIGTQNVIDCMSPSQLLLFGSTGSNYEKVDGICTGRNSFKSNIIWCYKNRSRRYSDAKKENSMAYRLATAFGISHRLRMDLLINDLTYKVITEGALVIYQSSNMHNIYSREGGGAIPFLFLHYELEWVGQVYNCGSNDMNYSKKIFGEMIKDKTGCYVHYNDFDYDKDNRDYEVSYDKLEALRI